MKLNFKGFFKAAGLCSTGIDALTGCITWGSGFQYCKAVAHASSNGGQTRLQGLSLAEDSNGTKGYVFVGESLDYLYHRPAPMTSLTCSTIRHSTGDKNHRCR